MTILEVLQNAQYNLSENGTFGIEIAKNQLNNAVGLLEEGYELEDDFDESMKLENGEI